MAYSFSRLSWVLPALAAAGLSALGASPAKALNPENVRPIIRNVDGATGAGFTEQDGNSFGFFFDITEDNVFTNALGFLFQDGWFDDVNNNSYDVTLWSYILDPDNDFIGDYSEFATKRFTPGDPNLFLLDSAVPPTGFGNYYWLPLNSLIDLPNTGASVDPDELIGYVLGVSGVFSGPGSVLVATGGTPNFAPVFSEYLFEGYNFLGGEDAPVPVLAFPFAASGLPEPGFWNANISIDVPGPLPVLGAGSAFVWSRRLKRKIKMKA